MIFLRYFLISENEFLMLFKKIWSMLLISKRDFNIKNSRFFFLSQINTLYPFSDINHSNIWYQKHLLIRKNIKFSNLQKQTFIYFWYKEITILHHCLYKKYFFIPKIWIYHKKLSYLISENYFLKSKIWFVYIIKSTLVFDIKECIFYIRKSYFDIK